MRDESDPTTAEERPSLAGTIARIHSSMANALSAGDVAALRRLEPSAPGGSAFWRLVPEQVIVETGLPTEEAERRWGVIVSSLALAGGRHRLRARLGEALAQVGLSEGRLDRLLRARGPRLHDEVRIAARRLDTRARDADWTEVARLVLDEDDERARRNVARDYYRSTPHD
jgi:CRISPR type I-E-associated protein CasB/Cse2